MSSEYIVKHDDDGKVITDLSSYELRRRIAIIDRELGGDWRSKMFKRAYEAALSEREAQS